jgi:hypothetical protein
MLIERGSADCLNYYEAVFVLPLDAKDLVMVRAMAFNNASLAANFSFSVLAPTAITASFDASKSLVLSPSYPLAYLKTQQTFSYFIDLRDSKGNKVVPSPSNNILDLHFPNENLTQGIHFTSLVSYDSTQALFRIELSFSTAGIFKPSY